MIDFSSLLYLGFHHPSSALPAWEKLSLGRPAALQWPPGALRVSRILADLTGCERVVLGPSSLHLFKDLTELLARKLPNPKAFFMDGNLYPVPRWSVDWVRSGGPPVLWFRHQDPRDLARRVDAEIKKQGAGLRPVVYTDGFCPRCGKVAPLGEYRALVDRHRGRLVVDDTQALGILGRSPTPKRPYGSGGNGSFHWLGLEPERAIVVASVAKGLGVPLAFIGGDRSLISDFTGESETMIHCSPPATPLVLALDHALLLNRIKGDLIRRRLLSRVAYFRQKFRNHGPRPRNGLFPIQYIPIPRTRDPLELFRLLWRAGIRTVLQPGPNNMRPHLLYAIRADHRPGEIDRAANILDVLTQRSLEA